MDTKYNGRTNRATWLVMVHYNPETLEDLAYAKESLEEAQDELMKINPCLHDMVNISNINRNELEKNIEEEQKLDETR